MYTDEKRHILDRPYTEEHYKLKIAHLREKPQIEYYREMELVFDHQRAVFNDPSEGGSKEDILASHFYNQCYRQPDLLSNSGPVKSTIEELLNATALSIASNDRNNIKYLLGEVGVGKTAFINYLISVYLQKYVHENKIWFVRLDIHEAMQGRFAEVSAVAGALATKICKVIQNNLYLISTDENSPDFNAWVKFNNLVMEGSDDLRGVLSSMLDLVRAIRKVSGRQLFLIFDNLDFLCHLNDRGLFTNNEDTGLKPFLITIYDLISHFTHGSILSSLESNILIASRFDSYSVIETGDHTDRMPKREDVGYFTLELPDPEEVYISRKRLLDFTFDRFFKDQPRKIEDYKKITALIEVHMNHGTAKERRLSDSLKELARCGYRDVMQFFAQYAWISDKDSGSRLIHQYPVGLLTYMLNNCRRFSQSFSCFPNIYLVNIEQGEDSRDDDPCSPEHMHPHTYWLKWFIAVLIGKRKHYNTADYIGIFKGNQGDGYGEKEIRKCLASLTEANLTNMVRAKFRRNPRDQEKLVISDIELTKRGKHCFSNVFNRFYYLQLIVDDYLLPIPRCIHDEFEYDNHNLDYGYVTYRNQEDYWTDAKKMIRLKAKQVFLFLITLEESLKIECAIHTSIFDRLEVDDVFPPSIDEVRQTVRADLQAIARNHPNFIDIEDIEKKAENQRARIASELAEMYLLSIGREFDN